MHYLIDGYNLLFRLSDESDLFQKRRAELIDRLLKQVELLHLSVTVVFDSTYQYGDATRGYKGNLEIVYTARGETADEYILEALSHRDPTQVTVITSDKQLAWKARASRAHTESVPTFLAWLSRRSKNKKRPKAAKKLTEGSTPKSTIAAHTDAMPSPEMKAEECVAYYAAMFEEKFLLLMTEAEKEKELKQESRASSKKKIKKKKEKKPASPPSPMSELQRWLELFEKSH